MWVARDKGAVRCRLFVHKPKRYEQLGMWMDGKESAIEYGLLLDSDMFTYVKWEDEPLEVDLHKVDRHYIQCDKCGRAFSYLGKDVETIEICTQPSSPYADEFEIVHCPHCKSEVFL